MNLRCFAPRVWLVVIDPDGAEIARLTDFGCTNVCFGPEEKILHITAIPGLWALKID